MREMAYVWHLRAKMAEQGMFATTDLQPLLGERGVVLSREQTYRLVTGHPQRLSVMTLVALCDILGCTPNDLIEPQIVEVSHRRVAGEALAVEDGVPEASRPVTSLRTKINRPGTAR
ncbi:helix-turn-helix transcriptional regulator [Microbacterium sp. ISL-59]|uniref:helix-turn-helix domain-containing protein n=1 Tax=Microbacterium sp. ISL-59 TaxID=2819159 RepID=UPI001BE8E40A|nr:helix-turn-helix transcriptional regulator [Microbacterium sp. ISL-59]MBT2495835.1 helix-turn-helix transcriptional regulator [Microbacterium sp. ISL-59]